MEGLFKALSKLRDELVKANSSSSLQKDWTTPQAKGLYALDMASAQAKANAGTGRKTGVGIVGIKPKEHEYTSSKTTAKEQVEHEHKNAPVKTGRRLSAEEIKRDYPQHSKKLAASEKPKSNPCQCHDCVQFGFSKHPTPKPVKLNKGGQWNLEDDKIKPGKENSRKIQEP